MALTIVYAIDAVLPVLTTDMYIKYITFTGVSDLTAHYSIESNYSYTCSTHNT